MHTTIFTRNSYYTLDHTKVSATLVDGTKSQGTVGALMTTFIPAEHHLPLMRVKQLGLENVHPIHAGHQALCELLLRDMPQLEDLTIGISDEYLPSLNCPPSLQRVQISVILQSTRLPSLRNLVLRGRAHALIPGATLSNLRSLVLKGLTEGDQPSISLDEFLDCIGMLSSIEELTVYDYLRCATSESALAYSRDTPLLPALKLRVVNIAESPQTLSLILSRIATPLEAHVTLTVRGKSSPTRSTLVSVLPINAEESLPILRRASRVIVSCNPQDVHTSSGYYLRAEHESGGYVRVQCPSQRTANSRIPTPWPEPDTFEEMVGFAASMFFWMPITEPTLIGNLDGIPRRTWMQMFNGFPELRRLEVDDPQLRGSALPCLSALMTLSDSVTTPLPVCNSLESFTLASFMAGTDILEQTRRCLQWRKEHGCGDSEGRIQRLRITAEPGTPGESLTFQSDIEEYRRRLERLAVESTVIDASADFAIDDF